MVWLDMPRDKRLPVVWPLLAALCCLPAVAHGQLPRLAQYYERTSSGTGSPAINPSLAPSEAPSTAEQPDAGTWTSLAKRAQPDPTPAPAADPELGPLPLDELGEVPDGPDYAAPYGGMVPEEPCGYPTSIGGLLSSIFDPPERHRGVGHPLQQESWLYRPFSAGWFMGMVQGGPLVDDWLGQQRGFVGGYRFGWDQDYYWGGEMRFAFASIRVYDSPRAIAAQHESDPGHQWMFEHRRDSALFQWDLCVLHYPWGDAQWRPYLLAGVGTARIRFTDRLLRRCDETVFAMPLAVGLKYRCNEWLALRFECADNIAFGGGSGFETVHNVSVTGGAEVRFGGTRKAYWPWNPGRHYW
jgi:hypothetical protein